MNDRPRAMSAHDLSPLLAAVTLAEEISRDVSARQALLAPWPLSRALKHQSWQETAHAAVFRTALQYLPGRASCPALLEKALRRYAAQLHADLSIYVELAEAVLQAGLNTLDCLASDGNHYREAVLTPTIFFPLAVDLIPQSLADSVVAAHLDRDDGFKVPWPLPTVRTSDPAFFAGETPFLWRGPTWSLRKSLWGLVARSGFREYYDPIHGDGLGAKDFTWSGLLIDM